MNDPSRAYYLLEHTVGELRPLPGRIEIVEYNPEWPRIFQGEADKILSVLGERVLGIEHVGSTSVKDLASKPVIDMVLVVRDSSMEDEYVPPLEEAGYQLRIREPGWHEHRMLERWEPRVNLHVFSKGCSEVNRMLAFRDWLRTNAADRNSYAGTKLALAEQEWKYMQNYADAKTAMIEEILGRLQKQP